MRIDVRYSAERFYPEKYFELFRVNVHHTGRVRWWFGGVMETYCHLDGTLFPFDSQACNVIVQSWAYSQGFVDLVNASDVVHMEEFEGNGNVSRRLHAERLAVKPKLLLYLDSMPFSLNTWVTNRQTVTTL